MLDDSICRGYRRAFHAYDGLLEEGKPGGSRTLICPLLYCCFGYTRLKVHVSSFSGIECHLLTARIVIPAHVRFALSEKS